MGAARRLLGPVLLAALMLAAAAWLDRRAVIFPEAVALAYGLAVLRRASWSRPVPLVVLPAITAAIGLGCAWAPGPRWVWTVVALVLATGVLHVARSPLIPALSAAVLPVVFGIHDVAYLMAVVTWCGLLALCLVVGRGAPGEPGTARPPAGPVVTFTAVAAAWIAVVGLVGLPSLAIAPPLIVAGLEFATTDGRPLSWRVPRRIGLMAVAGALGATAAALPVPEALGAAVGVAVVMALAAALGEPLTPAVALVLVPFVAEVDDPWRVALWFLVGGLVLTVVPAALLRARRPRPRTAG